MHGVDITADWICTLTSFKMLNVGYKAQCSVANHQNTCINQGIWIYKGLNLYLFWTLLEFPHAATSERLRYNK